MMTYVEQQEQVYMTREVKMPNERDTWMSEALTLKRADDFTPADHPARDAYSATLSCPPGLGAVDNVIRIL
eukprot:3844217-Amphidinium_carterae.1